MDGALWMYFLLALSTAPPLVPNAALIATAGMLAQAGELDLWLVLAVVAGSALAGDALVYGVGKLAGPRVRDWLQRRPTRKAALDWMADRITRHGVPFVVGMRFLPSGRLIGGLTAAVVEYPLRRFLLGAGIAEAFWASYSVALGYWGGAALDGAWSGVLLGTLLSLLVAGVAQLISSRTPAPEPPERAS
ncbi:DedA family protein [Streptomyces sp. 3MP-14]|uniref:DedA family protein n=1 Tax=Streptomyces mimosae TaxID=2586635 RepID=A0A5N6ATQ7_9ACTN|nr:MULTISPECIES: VTT domain-containing protein [Streptomyces]KAB8171129.1 DedA family protein [Streptomyces mimosae]KAB8179519.1 DedA family protein [Streptomyces sp. 3MP-14]